MELIQRFIKMKKLFKNKAEAVSFWIAFAISFGCLVYTIIDLLKFI